MAGRQTRRQVVQQRRQRLARVGGIQQQAEFGGRERHRGLGPGVAPPVTCTVEFVAQDDLHPVCQVGRHRGVRAVHEFGGLLEQAAECRGIGDPSVGHPYAADFRVETCKCQSERDAGRRAERAGSDVHRAWRLDEAIGELRGQFESRIDEAQCTDPVRATHRQQRDATPLQVPALDRDACGSCSPEADDFRAGQLVRGSFLPIPGCTGWCDRRQVQPKPAACAYSAVASA